ncbi:hypothetical protein HQ545_07645 [Candidatus Woesearchaeota archaeon]|nr:hypothetical protein [Candidatus Woesearchaeota archaeon]
MNLIMLEATIGTIALVGGILAYIKYMKRRVRKFVLRNDKIDKYYRK